MTLDSLPDGYRAAVFGASGGIGAAFVAALCADARCAKVHAGARDEVVAASAKVGSFRFDLQDESSISAAVTACTVDGPLHLVLVTTGILHSGAMQPEKSWRALSTERLQRAFAINTIGPALIATRERAN